MVVAALQLHMRQAFFRNTTLLFAFTSRCLVFPFPRCVYIKETRIPGEETHEVANFTLTTSLPMGFFPRAVKTARLILQLICDSKTLFC